MFFYEMTEDDIDDITFDAYIESCDIEASRALLQYETIITNEEFNSRKEQIQYMTESKDGSKPKSSNKTESSDKRDGLLQRAMNKIISIFNGVKKKISSFFTKTAKDVDDNADVEVNEKHWGIMSKAKNLLTVAKSAVSGKVDAGKVSKLKKALSIFAIITTAVVGTKVVKKKVKAKEAKKRLQEIEALSVEFEKVITENNLALKHDSDPKFLAEASRDLKICSGVYAMYSKEIIEDLGSIHLASVNTSYKKGIGKVNANINPNNINKTKIYEQGIKELSKADISKDAKAIRKEALKHGNGPNNLLQHFNVAPGKTPSKKEMEEFVLDEHNKRLEELHAAKRESENRHSGRK